MPFSPDRTAATAAWKAISSASTLIYRSVGFFYSAFFVCECVISFFSTFGRLTAVTSSFCDKETMSMSFLVLRATMGWSFSRRTSRLWEMIELQNPYCGSFLCGLFSYLQSLYQRQNPSSYIQVVRDAQRLPDVWLVIVESLLEDLPLRWPVSRLPPPVTDHDTDPGWRRQEMPGPWRKRGVQHHRRLTPKLPQVSNRERVNYSPTDMSTECWRHDIHWVMMTDLASWYTR